MLGSPEDPDLLKKFEVAAGVLDERACLLRQIMDNPAPGEHQLEHEQGLVKQGRQTASVAVPSFMHIKSLAHLEEYASTLAEIDTPEDLASWKHAARTLLQKNKEAIRDIKRAATDLISAKAKDEQRTEKLSKHEVARKTAQAKLSAKKAVAQEAAALKSAAASTAVSAVAKFLVFTCNVEHTTPPIIGLPAGLAREVAQALLTDAYSTGPYVLQLADECEVYTKPDGELRMALNQYQHEILIPKPDGSSNISANGRSLKAKKNLAINALMQAVSPLGMASLTFEQLKVACPARSLETLQKIITNTSIHMWRMEAKSHYCGVDFHSLGSMRLGITGFRTVVIVPLSVAMSIAEAHISTKDLNAGTKFSQKQLINTL